MKGEKQPTQKRCRRITTEKEAHGFADDMVFEILTWLPAKSLMRFKCVSKAWNTLIRHDLKFVKLHIARSRVRPLATRLLFEVRIPNDFSKSEKKISTAKLVRFPLQLVRFPLKLEVPRNFLESIQIVLCSNHCNGLVCVYNRKDSQGYLYNITTGEIKALSFSLGQKSEWCLPQVFLGYDTATERYKLLHQHIGYKKRPCLKIRTLGTNSWRRISDQNRPERLQSLTRTRCAFLNGILYWNNYKKNIITYFNLTEEKFGTLSPPQESRLSEIQTALWGKLIVHPLGQPNNCHLVYDEVNKIFTKFDSDPDLIEEKVVSLEAQDIPQIPYFKFATSSLISTSTYLVFPDHIASRHVSRVVENIIPLTFIDV